MVCDPWSGLRDLGWFPLALLLASAGVLASSCGDDPVEDASGGERELTRGVAGSLISDGERAYLSTAGLSPSSPGQVLALNPDGEVVWSVAGAGAGMVGADRRLYFGNGRRIRALNREGELLSFNAPDLGKIAWHPWNMPMTYGADGVLVVDRNGGEIMREWSGVRFHTMASSPDGSIYAIVTSGETEENPESALWKMTAELDLLYSILIPPAVANARTFATHASIAIHEDYFIYSDGVGVDLRNHDGTGRGRFEPLVGTLLIAPDGTTYVSGDRNRVAISIDSELLWDIPVRSRLAWTRDGLVAMEVVSDRFASPTLQLARVDRSTGESSDGVRWSGASDFLAPVSVGSRVIGAAHRIDQSRGSVGGDPTFSQAATTSIATVAGGVAPGWSTAGGPGGRNALAPDLVVPDSADLRGIWVAVQNGAMRAIEFSNQASNFGLLGEPVYAIWEGELERQPRLVQVGTWSLEEQTLTLDPVADLAESRGRRSLRVRPALPGVLAIDDPVQDVGRAFSRAARLPGIELLSSGLSIDWIDRAGEHRAEFGEIDAIVPTEDGGAWIVSAYDATGYVGDRQFRPSFVDMDARGNVLSTLKHAVIAKVSADGDYSRYFHFEVDGSPRYGDLIAVGDGLRVIGPTADGAREREELLSMELVPSGADELVVGDKVAWPRAENAASEVLHFDSASLAGHLPSGDIVVLTRRQVEGAVGRETRRSSLVRFSAQGDIVWETDLAEDHTAIRFEDASVSVADDVVYLAGTTTVPFERAGVLVEPYGFGRAWVASIDLDTGEFVHLAGLGQGSVDGGTTFFVEASIESMPSNGFVHVTNARGSDSSSNTGTGSIRGKWPFNQVLVSRFDSSLESRWSTRMGSAPEDASIDLRDVDFENFSGARGTVLIDGIHPISDDSVFLTGMVSGSVEINGRRFGMNGVRLPVIEISACGAVVSPRWFESRVEVGVVKEGPDGTIWAGGLYQSAINEPPHFIEWPGTLPTPSQPFGNYNNLLMRLTRAQTSSRLAVDQCDSIEPTSSMLRVEPRGTGKGRVVSSPPGIDCPGQCEGSFPDLAEVVLTALPEGGHVFAGFSQKGHASSVCELVGECAVLVHEDTIVEARFDGLAPAWSHGIPFEVRTGLDVVRFDDKRVFVAGRADDAFDTLAGRYDPQDSGEDVLIVVSEAGVERALALNPSLMDLWEIGPQDSVVTVLERSTMQALFPDQTFDAPDSIVLMDSDGTIRWHHPLARSGGGTNFRVALGPDVAGVLWRAGTTIQMEEFEVENAQYGLALFDPVDGGVLSLQASNDFGDLRPNAHGGVTLFTSGAFDLPPPFDIPPGPARTAYLEFDRRGELVDVVRGAESAPGPLVTLNLRGDSDFNPGGGLLDENYVPLWAVVSPGYANFSRRAAWLTNVEVPSPALKDWTDERIRPSVVRVASDGITTHVWPTLASDQVEVFRASPDADRNATAVLQAQTLRDGQGDVLYDGEPAWFVVGLAQGEVE